MPPKRNGGARTTLHRVEDGLRRLFRNNRATKSNNEPTIYLHNTDWDGLERFSGILNVNENVFGPLTPTIGRFSRCVKMFEDQARAREEYKKLGVDLNDLFHALARHFETHHASTTLDSLGKLARSIDEEIKLLESDEDSGLNDDGSTKDLDQVIKCYRRIRTALALFVNTRLELLSHSPEGHYRAFGSGDQWRTGCTPKTRVGVLQDLREWVHYGKFQKVYWLNGITGSGKTTVAYSLCQYLENSGKPAASFFCSRDLPDCRDVTRIFPTVAYQLARLSRPFRCAVSSALEQDPEVCDQSIDEQFKKLIARPLQNVGHTFGVDVVIVIDALEECDDKDGANQILDACFEDSSGLPVRFLITSRRNPGILERMLASQGGQRRAELRLHEVDRTFAQEDVRTYLSAKLERFNLSDDDLECLVQRSGGWFLYAASVVRYISQDNPPNEAERLRRLLDISSYTGNTTDRDIDGLYTTILEDTVQQTDLEDPRRAEVMLMLRTTICAQGPVTMNTVAGLLMLDFDRLVHTVLHPLLPVLHVSNAGELGIIPYDSFVSYLVDPQISGRFYCDVQRDNSLLAQLCFAAIDGASPPFNVCNLESSYSLDQEVAFIEERVNESISQPLWYASRHWATHLKLAGHSDDLIASLHNILSRRLLIWMEIMNLKHHISEAAELVHGVHTWLQEVECPVSIRDLALDSWKFVEAFSSGVVSGSTPHIYVSALRFWPMHRPVSMQYIKMLRYAVKATGARLEWRGEDSKVLGDLGTTVAHSQQSIDSITGAADNNLDTLRVGAGRPGHRPPTGHTYKVLSVAYSPDGEYVVSGSGDRTTRIWNAHTGEAVGQPLNTHTYGVNSVSFSPDGAYIASGSEDKTICIWDAHTGQLVGQPLEGHTRAINSVAYSPDGAYLASGSDDMTVRIWNAHTGQPVGHPLEGHTSGIFSVAYSPDGAYTASGSGDRTFRIRDAYTGQPVGQPLKGHKGMVRSVAYSPDGAHIATGSSDGTVRIWDAHNFRPVGRPLEGHADWVLSVAYSPDGACIASGSYDGTVRVWDAHTGQPVGRPLEGHTGGIFSIAYSPDSAYVASGSYDLTLRVWDSRAGYGVQLQSSLQPTLSKAQSHKRSPIPSTFTQYVTRISKKSTPATNNPRILTSEKLQDRWTLNDQGWVVNAFQKRLVWVPQDLQDFILLPPTLAIMPLGDRVILDFRDAKLGTEWKDCFDLGQLLSLTSPTV